MGWGRGAAQLYKHMHFCFIVVLLLWPDIVFSVIADNLAGHSVAGFVESFSGSYVCRFCFGDQFQTLDVRTGAFPWRVKEQYKLDVETALASYTRTHAVKRICAISQRLNHVYVTTGNPPDWLHDLFQGIVPAELGVCLESLIKNKIFLSWKAQQNNQTFSI